MTRRRQTKGRLAEILGMSPSEIGTVSSWSREKVRETLQKLHSKGEDIRANSLKRNYPGLWAKVYAEGWNFGELYKEMGLNRKELNRHRIDGWYETRIIREIRAYLEKNGSLHGLVKNKKLYGAAGRHFGSIRNAVQAAGIDPSLLDTKYAMWPKERIISEIKRLHSKGENLDRPNIKSKYPDLEAAAGSRFHGTWYKALEAAGIDAGRHRKKRINRYWTKERVIGELQSLYHQGTDVQESYVRKNHPDLTTSAYKLFKGYYRALAAAGISPEEYRRLRPAGYWTKEKIIEELRRLDALGKDLSSLSMRTEKIGNALNMATSRVFGGHYKALEAAGIDVSKYQKFRRGYWSKEKVIELLHEYVTKYGNLDLMQKRDLNLSAACYREFGGLKKAVLAANLDYRSLVSKKQWTREEIIREIKQLRQMEEDLSSSTVASHYPDLAGAAATHFGSWGNAVHEAGFDYDKIRKDRFFESFKGGEFEKCVRKTLHILEWNVEYQRNFKFDDFFFEPDFFDRDTGAWIDAKLDAGGHGVHITIQRYLPFTDKLVIIYLKGKPRKRDSKYAEFIPIKDFYTQLRERGQEELIRRIELLRKGISDPDLHKEFKNIFPKKGESTS